MIRKYLFLLAGIGIFFFIAGCAGSKKAPKKYGTLRKNYHNLTSHYNAHFNADLKLKEGVEKLWDEQKDDYSQVLPPFKYGTSEDGGSIGPEMDAVTEKSTTAIQKHPKSQWVDDHYLLIGKANFYKKNFDEASKSFQYLSLIHI